MRPEPAGPERAKPRLSEPAGRRVLVTTVLGSSMALLDSTVVNVALPSLGRSLGAGIAGLQWTIDAYMLTLASFLLLGGSLGDRFGRRRAFVVGVWWFTLASVLCAAAPSLGVLVAARALQGIGGALLMPGALALIQSSIHRDDRARAIGAWSGLSGVAAAIGPLVGGWIVGALGWRWIFLLNVPIGAAVVMAARQVQESRRQSVGGRMDVAGAILAVVGLGAISYALISAGEAGNAAAGAVSGAIGVASLIAFVVVEHRSADPMLPLGLFESREFSVANIVTFFAYAALGGTFFFLVLFLQLVAGYTPLLAGLSLLPISIVMLLVSPTAGGLAGRIGPRRLLAGGSLVAGVGMALLAGLGTSPSFWSDVVPRVLVVAAGLSFVAAPVTVAVLAAADPSRAGAASGVNNAVARAAGLLAVAALPLLTGLSRTDYREALSASFPRAMWIDAALLGVSAILSLALIRDSRLRTGPDRNAGRES
ncbi:MAG TPA: MFS transporter [Vulgatibacter sp.]